MMIVRFARNQRVQKDDRKNLGISQQNTLECIEENKIRQEDRKHARQYPPNQQGGAHWPNYKGDDRHERSERSSHHQQYHRHASPVRRREPEKSSSGFEENRRRYNDRAPSDRISPTGDRTIRQREHQKGNSSTLKTQERIYVPIDPSRAHQKATTREGNVKSFSSPATAPANSQKRQSISSRLSDPRSGNASGEDRVSAKERLSVNTQRTNLFAGRERETGNL